LKVFFILFFKKLAIFLNFPGGDGGLGITL
jgi:hypothetical protein